MKLKGLSNGICLFLCLLVKQILKRQSRNSVLERLVNILQSEFTRN